MSMTKLSELGNNMDDECDEDGHENLRVNDTASQAESAFVIKGGEGEVDMNIIYNGSDDDRSSPNLIQESASQSVT